MVMTWEYIAGFLDADGHMHYLKCSKEASIAQKDPTVLYKIGDFLRANGITCNIYEEVRKNTPQYRKYWNLKVQQRESMERFIPKIFPYLIVKKVIAQDIMRFMKLFPRRRRLKSNVKVLP